MFEIVMGIDDFLIQLVKYCIWEFSRLKKYITRRFDIESAKINSIAILIGLLTELVIGIYDRALLYFSTLFGMQRGFSVHEFPPYYVVFMPALGGLIVGMISYFLMRSAMELMGLLKQSPSTEQDLILSILFLRACLKIELDLTIRIGLIHLNQKIVALNR